MESNSQYSFYLINPEEGERAAFGWGPVRSPNPSASNSPLSDFIPDGHDFPSDVETGSFHSAESPVTPAVDDLGTSTALIQGLGEINLANHSSGGSGYPVPVVRSGPGYRTNMTCKVEPPEFSGQWDSLDGVGPVWLRGGGAKYTSFTGDKSEHTLAMQRTYRPEQGLAIDTECFSPGSVIDPELLSGFSDHSTINSTPIQGPSSLEKDRIWASTNTHRQQGPYASSHQRKSRSSSLSHSDTVGHPSRKRAVSDTRLLPADRINPSATPDLTGSNTSNCFLSVPKQGTYEPAYTWDLQQKSQLNLSLDFVNAGRPADAVSLTDDQGRSPTFVYHQGNLDVLERSHWQKNLPPTSLHSPTGDAGAGQGPSSLTAHVSHGFRAHVASEAVVKAAEKKRRNRDGAKVFECHICSQQLTTKQNLQF
ncbi:hypothetical protein D9756_003225 [Leucocoprinus leucothites]|uniref:Uncharacterized protein n=1 Tax=Leucocoprinus leucothites TaxID=201217 RepID=A0A8H5LJ76_9AGAR|nr:hypothetical protein D9756_003225 [Leucoagaricus leucothites]